MKPTIPNILSTQIWNPKHPITNPGFYPSDRQVNWAAQWKTPRQFRRCVRQLGHLAYSPLPSFQVRIQGSFYCWSLSVYVVSRLSRGYLKESGTQACRTQDIGLDILFDNCLEVCIVSKRPICLYCFRETLELCFDMFAAPLKHCYSHTHPRSLAGVSNI